MTKEQYYTKYGITDSFIIADLEAVIATEIAKAKVQPHSALNEIEKAYHNYEPIRYILWNKGWNIKKHSDTESIDANNRIWNNTCFVFNFDTNPEKWELYTEPAEKPSSQAKLDNSFDKERFEAMFRAVVASGEGNLWSSVFDITNQALKQLDAYYASKEGGNNG